jgi:hypothetical protein
MIGTPFISDDIKDQRKVDKINKKPWEQEVRDEKGRKRLHGAFTGGFSAGYFNTVGTKEGWTPTNFKSSRNEKSGNNLAQIKRQDATDFMDEEDLKDQVGLTGLTTNENYRDFFSSVNSDGNMMNITSNTNNLNSLPNIFNEEVGEILLRESGLLDNKKYPDYSNKNNNNYNYNDNKYYNGRLEFKDDYTGVGYIPKIDEDIFYGKLKEKNESGNPNRIRMDKFEDDDEKFSEYNFEIMDENINNIEKRKKRLRDDKNDPYQETNKFIKSNSILLSVNIDFKMPELPKDYDPYKFVSACSGSQKDENKYYNIEEEIKKLDSSRSKIHFNINSNLI